MARDDQCGVWHIPWQVHKLVKRYAWHETQLQPPSLWAAKHFYNIPPSPKNKRKHRRFLGHTRHENRFYRRSFYICAHVKTLWDLYSRMKWYMWHKKRKKKQFGKGGREQSYVQVSTCATPRTTWKGSFQALNLIEDNTKQNPTRNEKKGKKRRRN